MQSLTRRGRGPLPALLLLALLMPRPVAWPQYPGVSPPALTGSTLGENLRHAAAATHTQVASLDAATDHWCRRAESANYGAGHFQQDFANIQWHFQQLRTQFNWLGQLALQSGRPRAENAVAELDAGLNIITELFVFLEGQNSAGTLHRATVLRTALIFQNAIREWEKELRKSSSRLGLAW